MRSDGIHIPLLLLIALYIISIIFFHIVEGWGYLNAAYFTTTTIATVGYGDIHPVTDVGKVGAIALIFMGISLAFYVITSLGNLRARTVDPHIQKRIETLRDLASLHGGGTKHPELNKIRKKLKNNKIFKLG